MTEPKMHRLVFMNADSRPKNVALDLAMEAVPHVMAWYGAYFAGDRYTVALDGRNVHIDGNGEPVCDVTASRAAAITAQAEEKAKRKREKALKRLADWGQEFDRAAAITDLAEADAPIVE